MDVSTVSLYRVSQLEGNQTQSQDCSLASVKTDADEVLPGGAELRKPQFTQRRAGISTQTAHRWNSWPCVTPRILVNLNTLKVLRNRLMLNS